MVWTSQPRPAVVPPACSGGGLRLPVSNVSLVTPLSRPLIVGDSLVLLAFSIGGIAFHDVPGSIPMELARIGLPFAAGYFPAAVLVGGLRRDPSPWRFAGSTVLAWLLGIGLGVMIRTVMNGRAPIPIFFEVTLLFTGLLLLSWRALYWWLSRPGTP